MVNSRNIRSEAQALPISPDGGSELLPKGLEALLSEETETIIGSFETMLSSSTSLGVAFHDVLEFASSDSNAPFTPLLKPLAMLVSTALDDFRAQFLLPATAPGHATRVKNVSEALERLRRHLVRLARDHEIEQEVIERHLARSIPFLRDIGVLIGENNLWRSGVIELDGSDAGYCAGDVAELYPAAIEALVLNLSAVLLPEAVFLRSLVIMYCLGPYVLGRGESGHFAQGGACIYLTHRRYQWMAT